MEDTGDWRVFGSCSRQDPKYFEIPDEDGVDPERKEEIRRDLLHGKTFCDGCVVKNECLEAATPIDKTVTIRGGILPSGYREATPEGGSRQRKVMPGTLASSDPWVRERIEGLPDVTGEDYCPSGDPVSESAIRESDLTDHGKSRSGVDPYGRCRRCKDRFSKNRAKALKRQQDRATL